MFRLPFGSFLLPFLIAGIFLAGCEDTHEDEDIIRGGETERGVEYWGVVQASTAVASLRFDDGTDGEQLSLFVADGSPNGIAEYLRGTATGDAFRLVSASGGTVAEGRFSADNRAEGTLEFQDGTARNFFLTRAARGAGRYDIAIDGSGRWMGSSASGDTLHARQEGDLVIGSIGTSAGEDLNFTLYDLSRKFPLGAAGGSEGSYTAIVTSSGNSITGRGGSVAGGSPNGNFIRADLPITTEIVPGVYFGRVYGQTDLLLVDIDAPTDVGGPKRVRVYLSDGEPEPAGDIQWFSGTFHGDAFAITSASGDARIEAVVGADGVSGTVTLGNAPSAQFFAGPAGEGAGVYEVTVDQNLRLFGTSEEGGTLELVRDGYIVDGVITTSAGTAFSVEVNDLVRGLRYPGAEEIATVPDSYLAFVSPHARFVVGRSGSVTSGSSGLKIIGLDMD